jgi:N-acetylneuraminate synthase
MSCKIVAEIGINHNGSVDLAKRMMDAAKAAGADYCKFQKRTVTEVYTAEELARPRESPFGHTNGDLKYGLELAFEQYCDIHVHSQSIDLPWFASPWDTASVFFLKAFQPPFMKVASACLTDSALLKAVKSTGIPVILSTGMSTLQEIDQAMDTLDYSQAYLLHTTSTYPCELGEINLRCIPMLHQRYPTVPVGFSSHSTSPWPAVMSVALGAQLVEAHLTLDRTMFGTDQSASLEPKAFAKMVQEIRSFEVAAGTGVKRVYPSEEPIKAKLRRVIA